MSVTITLDVFFFPYLLMGISILVCILILMMSYREYPDHSDQAPLPELPPMTYRTPYSTRMEDDMTYVEGIDYV